MPTDGTRSLSVAPEIVHGKNSRAPSDAWNLCVVLYAVLIGRGPFVATSSWQVKRLIKQGYLRGSTESHPWDTHPTQRSTIDQVMGQPGLSQGEEASPRPPVRHSPNSPDSTILKIMLNMGYHPCNTWVSVESSKFNDAMATYLILKSQSSQGQARALQVKPSIALALRIPQGLPFPCREQQQPGRPNSPSRRSLEVPACLPSPPLPPRGHTPPSLASQHDPAPPWQPPDSSQGWRRVRRRIATCIRQLCCIPCFPRPLSGKRVVALETPSPDRQHRRQPASLRCVDADLVPWE
ncbi:Sperm motility kinase 2A [Sciurus carolinensis]|uniref:Sperm motility kinase 2A n=1 Tax=Sciurus carolinensis TaxID=30640 RepID=A0AA41MG09_SCICA|nr:Sperm motility kinase 2A [Sciurus carolinensis]